MGAGSINAVDTMQSDDENRYVIAGSQTKKVYERNPSRTQSIEEKGNRHLTPLKKKLREQVIKGRLHGRNNDNIICQQTKKRFTE